MRFPKKIAVFGAGMAAFMVAGVAFAAWTSNGTGTGSAQAKTAVSLTTSAVSASGATLYPGADGKATIKVNNNNDYPIRITDVTYGTAAATTASGGIGTCATGTDGGLVFTNQSGLTLDVAAHGNANFDVNGIHMNGTSLNGCQGATFTIPVTLTGASNVTP
jgi:hypothetical protein